jgi:hypothetical protein
MWHDEGHVTIAADSLQRGTLVGDRRRRSTMLSGGIKRALCIELQNRQGRGIGTMRQLLHGLALGRKAGPSFKHRRFGDEPGSASSQALNVGEELVCQEAARALTAFNAWNRFTAPQRLDQPPPL